MTREDLIQQGEHKVRSNESLMLSYLEQFEILFKRKPKCAGCTFKSDWKRFVQGKSTKTFKMKTEKTFELISSSKSKIHTYKEGTRPRRTYGNSMTEDFAKKYLTTGSKEEIEARKKHFSKLPDVSEKPKKEAVVNDEKTILVGGESILLSEATGKLMDAYAKENNIDFGDAKRVDDKRAVIKNSL